MQSHLLKNGKICGPLPLLWLLGNNKYFLNNNLKMSYSNEFTSELIYFFYISIYKQHLYAVHYKLKTMFLK